MGRILKLTISVNGGGALGDLAELSTDTYNNFSQTGVSPRSFIATGLDGIQMFLSGSISSVVGTFVGSAAGGVTTLTIAGAPMAPAVAYTAGVATGVYVDGLIDDAYSNHRDWAIDSLTEMYNWYND